MVRKCWSSLTKSKASYVTVVPKRLIRFMSLDDRLSYELQWTLFSDGQMTVQFKPKRQILLK